MKVTMSFTLPKEREDFNLALKGVNYNLVIEDFENWLRSKIKYTDETTVTLEEVREKLNEFKNDNGVLE